MTYLSRRSAIVTIASEQDSRIAVATVTSQQLPTHQGTCPRTSLHATPFRNRRSFLILLLSGMKMDHRCVQTVGDLRERFTQISGGLLSFGTPTKMSRRIGRSMPCQSRSRPGTWPDWKEDSQPMSWSRRTQSLKRSRWPRSWPDARMEISQRLSEFTKSLFEFLPESTSQNFNLICFRLSHQLSRQYPRLQKDIRILCRLLLGMQEKLVPNS